MYTPQFAAINQVNYQNTLRLAMASLAKAERYAQLNLHAANVMLELSGQIGTAVAEIKDATGMAVLRDKLSVLGVQNAMAYSRGVYQIASETNTDFSELAAQGWSSYTENVTALADTLAKDSGSSAAATAIRATTAAFDQFSKSSKQLVRFADASERTTEAIVASAANGSTTTKATKRRKTA